MTERALKIPVMLFFLVIAGGCDYCENSGGGTVWDVEVDGEDTSSDARDSVRHNGDTQRVDSHDMDTRDIPRDTLDSLHDSWKPVDTEGDNTSPDADLPTAEKRSCQVDGEAVTNCVVQNPDGLGECDERSGAVFDGAECVSVRGCPCSGDRCPAFDSVGACASTCGRAGWCQYARMPDTPPDEPPTCEGGRCGEELAFCMDGSEEQEELLRSLLPSFNSVECGRYPEFGGCWYVGEESRCREGELCCTFDYGFDFKPDEFAQFCRVSLLPNARKPNCLYWE